MACNIAIQCLQPSVLAPAAALHAATFPHCMHCSDILPQSPAACCPLPKLLDCTPEPPSTCAAVAHTAPTPLPTAHHALRSSLLLSLEVFMCTRRGCATSHHTVRPPAARWCAGEAHVDHQKGHHPMYDWHSASWLVACEMRRCTCAGTVSESPPPPPPPSAA